MEVVNNIRNLDLNDIKITRTNDKISDLLGDLKEKSQIEKMILIFLLK